MTASSRRNSTPNRAISIISALGDGVSRSLSLDNYGKALSAAILGFDIDVPERYANLLRGG
ncbi:MAG TPA: hypothetical protein VF467_12575 [Afipia sp.]